VVFRAILGYEDVFVFKSDFECKEANQCILESPILKVFTFKGRTFNYQDALASVNVIDQVFPEMLRFKYVVNEKRGDDFSVVGITNQSKFNNYLFQQDSKQGFRVIYRLDSWGHFKFSFGVYERDKFKFEPLQPMNVTYTLDESQQFHEMNGCISNDVDSLEEFNFLGVSTLEFKNWVLFFLNMVQKHDPNVQTDLPLRTKEEVLTLLKSVDESKFKEIEEELGKFQMKISLVQDQSNILGEMIIRGNEIVDVRDPQIRIKPMDLKDFDYLSTSNQCDFFFGSWMLQKYNFKFYYVEYDLDYEFLFSYDTETEDYYIDEEGNKVQKSSPWKWIKMILVILIVVVVSFFFWKTFR
jgi:hypothetical protein